MDVTGMDVIGMDVVEIADNQTRDISLVDHLVLLDGIKSGDFRWKNLRHLVKGYLSQSLEGDAGSIKILDLGCGTGHLALDLIQSGYSVSAIDISKELVDYTNHKAREAGCELNASQMDILALPYREDFHAVVCLDVLEHVEKDHLALENIYSALKYGGIIVCAVPALSTLYGKRDRCIGHYRRYDKDLLLKEIEAAGFSLCSVRYWNSIGLIPVTICEKILRREIHEESRCSKSQLHRSLNTLLDGWFCLFENRVHMPLGLTLIAVARKPYPIKE